MDTKRIFLRTVVFFGASCILLPGLSAQDAWVLSDNERRAFLHYYSPVILKRADEDKSGHSGHDWITNFNFDSDGDFANNEKNWRFEKSRFLAGTVHSDWRIDPTLYTGLIEFMDPDAPRASKSLILIYHIYHAMQAGDIHDWERVEVRIDNVGRQPGSSEKIRYYVITNHKKHVGRMGGDDDLKFVDSGSTNGRVVGQHLLVWQAQWDGNATGVKKAELRYVQDQLSDVMGRPDAEADVNDGGQKPFHYIFADGAAGSLSEYFSAETITSTNVGRMAASVDDDRRVPVSKAIRIKYRLQDFVDIFPSHWVDANGAATNPNWRGPARRIALDSPISSDITGSPLIVPIGTQSFLQRARHSGRGGYPFKGWFWGTYKWGGKGNWTDDEYKSRGNRFGQHDYFAHDGGGEKDGLFLPTGWHLAENGGFDGRWINLFPNWVGVKRPSVLDGKPVEGKTIE